MNPETQTLVSTSWVFNYFSMSVHSWMNNQRQHGRALKHNTPVHVSSKHNRLRLVGCKTLTDRWKYQNWPPCCQQSQWEEVSLEADCHIYTRSSIEVPFFFFFFWVMPASVHVADRRALTLPVNSDMCVRRWRTAGRKISCCLNKRDQRDTGVVLRREQDDEGGWHTSGNVPLMVLFY